MFRARGYEFDEAGVTGGSEGEGTPAGGAGCRIRVVFAPPGAPGSLVGVCLSSSESLGCTVLSRRSSAAASSLGWAIIHQHMLHRYVEKVY
jgi:hypothetical protein